LPVLGRLDGYGDETVLDRRPLVHRSEYSIEAKSRLGINAFRVCFSDEATMYSALLGKRRYIIFTAHVIIQSFHLWNHSSCWECSVGNTAI